MKYEHLIYISVLATLVLISGYFYLDIAFSLQTEEDRKKMLGQLLLFVGMLASGYILYFIKAKDQKKRDESIRKDKWDRQKHQQNFDAYENWKKG